MSNNYSTHPETKKAAARELYKLYSTNSETKKAAARELYTVVLIQRPKRQPLVSYIIVLIQRAKRQPLMSYIVLIQRPKRQPLVSNIPLCDNFLRVLNFAILLTLTFGGYELMRIYSGSDNDL